MIKLRVRRLTLDNVNAADGDAVARAMRSELARLLKREGAQVLHAGRKMPRWLALTQDGAALPARPRQLGEQTARTIFAGLERRRDDQQDLIEKDEQPCR